ncbi:hypothetical protein ACFOWM_08230 [Ferruginibacter yonginensis]|uniref:Effector-binding domain-containing protein n=1 Tax=Ferruginibacter yonginensis TaxID=1310416 RepID=A0ABV8QRI7_9BACT
MKKIIIVAASLLLASLVFVYLLIPQKITASKIFTFKAPMLTVKRCFADSSIWSQWFPLQNSNSNHFSIANYSFNNIHTNDINSSNIVIKNDNYTLNSTVSFFPIQSDTVIVTWTFDMPATQNPIKKITYYFEAKEIKTTLTDVLNHFKNFIEDDVKVYGMRVKETEVNDTCIITIKSQSSHYPTTQQVYEVVTQLKNYATQSNATATNHAMFHITQVGDSSFYFMIGLPINKRLNNNGNIAFKQMLPHGKFLVSDSIIGGVQKVTQQFLQFEKYKADHKYISPAIPFQLLITDRSLQPDSSKWVTQFYYPVF